MTQTVTPFPGGQKPQSGPAPPDGEEPPTNPPINERVAKLETALAGIQHSQNITLAAVGIGFALMLTVLIYMLTRIDGIPTEFKDTTQALSAAITATSAKPTQVLLVPAPQPQPSPQEK